MSIEEQTRQALMAHDPLTRLVKFAELARTIDSLRSFAARGKEASAKKCADDGFTQREMAEAAGVGPAMVQQWVKRGRAHTDPF